MKILSSPSMMLKIFIAYFLVSASLFFLPLGATVRNMSVSFLYLISFFLEVIAAGRIVHLFGMKHRQGLAFFFIALGFGFAGLGQTLWFILTYLYHVDPYLSTAIFYFAAYAGVGTGFFLESRAVQIDWKKAFTLPARLVVGLGAFFALSFFFYEIFMIMQSGAAFLPNAISVGYVLCDIILILISSFVLGLSLEYGKGAFGFSWLAVFFGQFSILIGDILFATFITQYLGDVWPYTLINLVWILANLLIAFGFYNIGAVISKIQNKITLHAKSKLETS